MYIRRESSRLSFRTQSRRPRRWRWRWVGLLLLGLLGLAAFVYSQPQRITQAVLSVMGEAPTPLPLPGVLVGQAESAMRAGQLSQAISFYEQALEQRPENVDFLYAYGQLLIDTDRPQEAQAVSERILAASPADLRGLALQARALAWQRQGALAIPIAIAALATDPNNAALLEALTRAYLAEDRWQDALDTGLRTVQAAPDDVRARWAYANALAAVGASQRAIEQLERATALAPNFLPPYFELAFLYLALNRDQEAIDLYNRILSIEPRNARALLRQCEAYRKIGEFERAIGLCQDAADADPAFVPAQFRLGQLRYTRREFPIALAAFERCLAADPDNLDCQTMLGLTYYYLGRCDEASATLRTAQAQAQARSVSDTELISEGLLTLAGDPQCLGPASAPPQPEATAEATAEVTPDEGL